MINPGVNYNFIATNFVKAKRQLKQELESGIENPNRIKGVGLEGASRTGKTYDAEIFICQYIDKYNDKVIVIARDTLASLKDTTYETLKKVWKAFNYSMKVFNKSATDIPMNGWYLVITSSSGGWSGTRYFPPTFDIDSGEVWVMRPEQLGFLLPVKGTAKLYNSSGTLQY